MELCDWDTVCDPLVSVSSCVGPLFALCTLGPTRIPYCLSVVMYDTPQDSDVKEACSV